MSCSNSFWHPGRHWGGVLVTVHVMRESKRIPLQVSRKSQFFLVRTDVSIPERLLKLDSRFVAFRPSNHREPTVIQVTINRHRRPISRRDTGGARCARTQTTHASRRHAANMPAACGTAVCTCTEAGKEMCLTRTCGDCISVSYSRSLVCEKDIQNLRTKSTCQSDRR